MSLQVWLPLNKEGNFYNQGLLGDINVVNTPSFGSSGKIGSTCMTTGSFKLSAQQTSKVLNNEQFSFASWIYITQASGSTILFGNDNMYAPNNRRFTIFLYNTLQRIHLSWQNYDSNNVVSGSGTMTGDIIPINTWTHVAVTYSSSTNKATIYINGIKSVDYTIGKFTSPTYAYETTLIENSNTVYYNDYRLYDNCLSPKEVHEIAKGLVLHYPLNDQYIQSTVYDCSGYCNNGTVTGSLQVVNDSPRYKKSTEVTSVNKIQYQSPIPNQIQEFTFNIWSKITDPNAATNLWTPHSNGSKGICDGPGNGSIYSYNGGGLLTSCAFYNTQNEGKHVYPEFYGYKDENWHMYTIVGNNEIIKTYTDGINTGTRSLSDFKSYELNGFGYIGFTEKNLSSDFRIYSTALSDDDIKELYNTSAIINNNNTLQAYEFSEADTYNINKFGVLEGAEFIEQDGDIQINNTEQVFATEFIEI